MRLVEPNHRSHFALYYRIALDKNGARTKSGLPDASAGQWPFAYVGAGIAETPDDIGMKIFDSLYNRFGGHHKDSYFSVLFTSLAFLGREIEGRLYKPKCHVALEEEPTPVPSNDVHDMPINVSLVVGDMPQAHVPITHLLLRGAFSLHVPCPPRQHFHISVDDGKDEEYDGRVWWFSLEGFRFRDERTD